MFGASKLCQDRHGGVVKDFFGQKELSTKTLVASSVEKMQDITIVWFVTLGYSSTRGLKHWRSLLVVCFEMTLGIQTYFVNVTS